MPSFYLPRRVFVWMLKAACLWSQVATCVTSEMSEDFNIHRALTPANESLGRRRILDKPSETPGVNIEKTVHIILDKRFYAI